METASARDGRVYEVTLIRAGETLHGWLFPPQVLIDSVPLWEGVTSLVDHQSYHPEPREVVGTISKVRFEKGALQGEYRFHDSREWIVRMVDQIITSREAGLLIPEIGLSPDMVVEWHYEGQRHVVEKILDVLSVDVVFRSAAGGGFERVLTGLEAMTAVA